MVKRTATVKIGVEHNASEITRGFSRIDRRLDEAMLEGVHQAAIRSGIPYGNPDPLGRDAGEQGHARDTWEHFVEPTPHGGRAIVSSEDPVAFWYWSGTRRHKIPLLPKPPGESLRFFWKGKIRNFTQVEHPGTKPHPYVEQGGTTAEPGMGEDFDREVDKVFRDEGMRS